MLTSEEKLQHFSQMIFKEAEQQKQAIMEQAQAECKTMRDQFETQCLETAYKTIQKKITAMQKESNETVARMQTESRQALLARREEMVREIFDAVRIRLEAFKQTQDYQTLLFDSIRAGIAEVGGDGIVVYLDHSDAHLSAAVGAEFPAADVQVLPAEDEILGGARVLCRQTRAISDRTLAARLQEEHDKFIASSGLVL